MLTLDRKLYQLIIGRLDGDSLSEASYRRRAFELVERGIGGFIVFGGAMDETRGFIHDLQAATETPLFIASDVERGVGQQIEGATVFPPQMALAAAVGKDAGLLTDAARAVAEEALYIGINMPLIPVLDVNTNPENPIICTRAFSDDGSEVARLGRAYVKTLEASGLLSCGKHFPGHGDTSVDSHISLPVISKSLEALMESDMPPFREAVRAGVSAIMVGHLSVPAVDDEPATVSGKIVTGLLRERLGHRGLVITDALNMHALKNVKDVYGRSLNAGVDVLLHPADFGSAVAELKDNLESGLLSEERIDDAVERIVKYKSGIKELQARVPDYGRNRDISTRISDMSVTLVKGTPGLLPVKKNQDLSIVIAAEKDVFDTSPLKEFLPGAARALYLDEGGSLEPLSSNAAGGEGGEGGTVILAVFTSVAAWKGSSGVGEEAMALLKGLIRKSRKTIVVSFGSPYVLRDFSEADALIAAYDGSDRAQRSVIKCLTGEKGFRGALPVRLRRS